MHNRTFQNYLFGLALSVALTFCAFGRVEWHIIGGHEFPPHELVVPAITVLALLQLGVQRVLFLHVGKEPRPMWNLVALAFAGVVVAILIGGTLWIMNNLAPHSASSGEPFIEGVITPQSEN